MKRRYGGRRRYARSRRGRRLLDDQIVPVGRRAGALAAMAVGRAAGYAMRDPAMREVAGRAVRVAGQYARRAADRASRLWTKRGAATRPGGSRIRRSGATSKARARGGRRRPLGMRRLQKMLVPYRVFRFQGMNIQDDATVTTAGYFPMPNRISSTTTDEPVPIYVVSLNGTVVSNQLAVVMRRARLHSTGRVSWDQISGEGPTPGSTGANWFIEKSSPEANITERYRYVMQNWYDIRLNMYGSKTQRTQFIVEYIQCNHDFAAVEDEADVLLPGTGTHADHYRDITYGYWQNKLKPILSNPIATGNALGTARPEPYVTLRRWSYDVAPSLTIEEDDTPNNVILKTFIRDGRILDHCWAGPTGAYDATNVSVNLGIDDYIQNPNNVTRDVGGNIPVEKNPHPKSRRYLVIRAVNPTRIASGAETNANTPSFDLLVRKAERLGIAVN